MITITGFGDHLRLDQPIIFTGIRTVARTQAATLDERRPCEPQFGNIVGAVIVRLVGAILLEQNDEWQLQHGYVTLETISGLAEGTTGALPKLAVTAAA